MIELRSISKSFTPDQEVLSNISLQVGEGEITALIGPSGSGKTTLLKIMNGLQSPSSGEVYLRGELLKQDNLIKERRKTGYIIQEVGLFPHYTVYENIALVPNLLKIAPSEIDQKIHYWMDLVGLPFEDFAEKMPHQLSGGQAQRVGIARALISEPDLILMDEPFSALDPEIRKQIRRDFLSIQKKQKAAVIIVTHDLLEAIEMADRICFLAQGKIQQLSDPKSLIFKPKNQQVINFIESDRFNAGLACCELNDITPYLSINIHQLANTDLLTLLSNCNTGEQQLILEAYYNWKGAFYD